MKATLDFSIFPSGKQIDTTKENLIISADLRLKRSKIFLYEFQNGMLTTKLEQEFPSSSFASFTEMMKQFIDEHQLSKVSMVSVAVPGPVIEGVCKTVNLPWKVEDTALKDLGIGKISLINDLEATAYSLSNAYSVLETIHATENRKRGNVAILAPDIGLGEAGLFYDGKFLHPFATEGGHSEFSPRNQNEIQFYQFLNKVYGIVTWEKVLSRKGLYDIYRFLRDVGRHQEEIHISSEKLKKDEFLPSIAEIGKTKKSRLVNITIEAFWEFLAREANNLVLKLKATGGLILTGEMVNTLFDQMDKEKFYKDFQISDKMESLLKDIPIYILRNKDSIAKGAAYYAMLYDTNFE